MKWLAEPVWFDRVAAGVGEHEATPEALEDGGGLVAAQDRDGEPVERDQADATGGLGLAEGQFFTVVLELPADQQRTVMEVQVAPAQRADLATAQPNQGDQQEQRIEAE